MKKIIYILAVSLIATTTVISSCNSPSKKVDKARENVQEAQNELNETKAEAEIEQQKVATAEEWKAFKNESENKIKENDARIAELRAKIMKPSKALDSIRENRIVALEQKNNILKAKIIAYENEQSDWESFKREFNHDMGELGNAFKDLTKDNKE